MTAGGLLSHDSSSRARPILVLSRAGITRCRSVSSPTLPPGRMVQGLGSTCNIMALFLVNLIGYSVGIAGTRDLVGKTLLAADGQVAIAASFAVVFSAVQVNGVNAFDASAVQGIHMKRLQRGR